MRTVHRRRHIVHFEVPGGTSHVTWRLHRRQRELTPPERDLVIEILRREHGSRCQIIAAVVMDDHVHLLITPIGGVAASKIVHSCKSVSAHQLVERSYRTAPIWQPEYYQRWIASPALIPICASYIRDNPRRKWPGIAGYPWVLP